MTVTPWASVQSITSVCTGERMPIWTVRRGSTSPSAMAWKKTEPWREGLAEIVRPGVHVGVEMDQRERAGAGGECAQQRRG